MEDGSDPGGMIVTKRLALIEDRVCVAVVDLVANRTANLYRDLLKILGGPELSSPGEVPPLYAVACRASRKEAPG